VGPTKEGNERRRTRYRHIYVCAFLALALSPLPLRARCVCVCWGGVGDSNQKEDRVADTHVKSKEGGV
jgi:hypothetical protein